MENCSRRTGNQVFMYVVRMATQKQGVGKQYTENGIPYA